MKNKFSNKHRVWFAMLVIYGLCWYLFWQTSSLQISQHEYYSEKLSAGFNDFRIVQISDLHNASFGKEQRHLLEKIAAQKPDVILITGDIIDRRRYSLETAMEFVEGAVKLAPVYYCSGNHEAWSGAWQEISTALREAGVILTDNRLFSLERNGEYIMLAGIPDPAFDTAPNSESPLPSTTTQFLAELPPEQFMLLLAHRPEFFAEYAEHDIELVFSGHAHGGQVRLPFIGALFAPGQGVLPQYTAGEYELGKSTLFVSRGLGNSVFPFRIGNRPHIISLTLKSLP